jgi:hypothetical protein
LPPVPLFGCISLCSGAGPVAAATGVHQTGAAANS